MEIHDIINAELVKYEYRSVYNKEIDSWTIWRPKTNVYVSVFYERSVRKFYARTASTIINEPAEVNKFVEELNIASRLLDIINELVDRA